MARRSSIPNAGFTLLELCVAILIVLIMMSVAIPSMSGLLSKNQEEVGFKAFDELVKDARQRSVMERRAYVLVWTKKHGKESVLLRPDGVYDPEKGTPEVVREWPIQKGDLLTLTCPAALMKNYEAVWTFWPTGACEPVTVNFKPKEGIKWSATYNPFTAEATVRYE